MVGILKRKGLAIFVVIMLALTFFIQIAHAFTKSTRLFLDLPEGTEITESEAFTGSLSDTGSKTSFPPMPFSYYEGDYFWIELSSFDILLVELEMDRWVDLDLGVWSLDEDFAETSVGGGPKVEEIAFISGYDSKFQIFIGCFSGNGNYELSVRVERVKEMTGTGNITGFIEGGNLISENDFYKFELRKGDHVVFTLSSPSKANFNLEIFREENWNVTTEEAQLSWEDPQGKGEKETVEFSIPQDGAYIVRVQHIQGKGNYSLTCDISPNPSLIFNLDPLIFYIILGIFSTILITVLIVLTKDRTAKTVELNKSKEEKPVISPEDQVTKLKKQIEDLDFLYFQKRISKRAYDKVRSELHQKLKNENQK